MTEFAKDLMEDVRDRMQKAVEHLKQELQGIRTGRATPALVENIKVDYYGTPTPLLQLAQISIPDARQIAVKPFDASASSNIEKAILKSDLGLNPSNDGKVIRLTLPMLSEEQRKKFAGRVKDIGEQARVGLRNIRRDANKHVDQQQKAGEFSEDVGKDLHDRIQDLLKEREKEVEEILSRKIAEIMEV